MADRTPPTPFAMLIGTAIISLITGYMIGIGSSLGFLPIPFTQSATSSGPRTKTSNYDNEEESSEEEVEDVLLDHAPNWANGEAADRRDGLRISDKLKAKMTDLGMTKGKSLPKILEMISKD